MATREEHERAAAGILCVGFWSRLCLGLVGCFAFVLLASASVEARRGKRRSRVAQLSRKKSVRVSRRPRRRRRRVSCRRLLKRKTALRYIRKGRRLEVALRAYLRDLHRCRLLRSFDRTRVLVYDYRNCKLAAIRQNTKTSAASLIKPFVMLAVYHKARRRGLRSPQQIGRKIQRHINLMMRVSNNRSTNYLIKHYLGRGNKRRGLRYINKILPSYGIRRTRLVELIPRGGRTYRNYTTARDLSILLYKIFRKKAISRAYSRKMLRVMLYSRDNRGKTSYLRSHYDVRAATKTGYTRRTNGVAGVMLSGVGLRRKAYNFVAIISRPLLGKANEWRWRKISTRVVRRLSEMTFRHYAKGYATREVRRFGGRPARGYCRR